MKTEWLNALYGGILIGISVSLMLLWNGRVTGISGIIYGFLNKNSVKGDKSWRVSFLLGLMAGGFALSTYRPDIFSGALPTENWTVIVAGLLVGFGTVLGSGCTSGHGVCGISRMSLRSLLATCLFVMAGMIAVVIFRKLGVVP